MPVPCPAGDPEEEDDDDDEKEGGGSSSDEQLARSSVDGCPGVGKLDLTT